MSTRTPSPEIEAVARDSRQSSAMNRAAAWTDSRLVRECVRGNEEAWATLIDKYKRLIYSIPIKYGLSIDEANDIFQNVCLDLLSELTKLREPKALPKWIMQVTSHRCLRQKTHSRRMELAGESDEPLDSEVAPIAERILCEAAEEQSLRDAISGIPPRCQKLVEMLFFEEPPKPYNEIARSLGIATGSIGFIRQRCLDRLRKRLGETGFR
ncbi:MAG TPA: sigma-70 family RNA polymerase sigma factor [Candidatus Acidoferrales bacterium]|nr:sigma-70 family RNA polymerase sigma factor [Candidatus Acidoferrales bacterium]